MFGKGKVFGRFVGALTLGVSIAGVSPGLAQHASHEQHEQHTPAHPTPKRAGGGGHHHSMSSATSGGGHGLGSSGGAGAFLLGQSSGTGFQPSAWPMPGRMGRFGGWHLMTMGQAYFVGTKQGGLRGRDGVYSSNWAMLAGVRSLGGGGLMVRTMISLEPLTVSGRQYPLLFQTGERAHGKPIVDGQHPHDLFMELSVQYAHPVGRRGILGIYYAPVGDVAMGPVAFPHRASALELPQATLSHHWQDATHIANNLATVGFSYGRVRWEGSGFYGREPNEGRWNIDFGRMDSWATRLSVFATENWMGQASVGRLNRPEAFHPDDVVRTTASVQHIAPRPGRNAWATSLIWARNYKTSGRYATHAVTAETLVPVGRGNFLTGRVEWSQRDELFEYDHDLAERIRQATGRRAFPVAAYTVGYTRDLDLFRSVQTGVGANVTAYSIHSALKPFYGERPWGLNLFARIRLK